MDAVIDPDILAQARVLRIDASVLSSTDPVVVLTSPADASGMHGGTFADVDRARASGQSEKVRRRAEWRPPLTNRGIADHFAARAVSPRSSAAAAAEAVAPTAVRMPRPQDGSNMAEVVLFWAAVQLLSDWQPPDLAAQQAAVREVRAACGAAHYARAKNVDATLIEESLSDIGELVASLLRRRQSLATADRDAAAHHRDAVHAVSILATGLPSAARLRIEEML
ncbi:hypothetical protein AB0C65_35945 [Nocardia sp. NPDC048505]|uniref:hypothetical protein n=1 Tax=Nocardia sp. NPDC048505 TaxID=3155756 RepID=UPI00340893CA